MSLVPPSALSDRALGVAVGLLLDRLLGEPPDAWHPVAWFGTAMGRTEQVLYADARLPGAAYALVGVGLGVGSGLVLHLSEHHGDGTPGTVLFCEMTGIEAFHAELSAKLGTRSQPVRRS